MPANLNIPDTTLSSGNDIYAASFSILAASGFVVSNTATVTFEAGTQINLEPGFHATAGSSSLVFHAIIGTVSNPILTTTSLPAGTLGICYSVLLGAAGGSSPYHNWTATGTLPPGLTLAAATGQIAGTPTSTSGSPFSFSVTVMDNANATSQQQSLSIVINPASGNIPSKEYIRLGNRVIAVEKMSCTGQ